MVMMMRGTVEMVNGYGNDGERYGGNVNGYGNESERYGGNVSGYGNDGESTVEVLVVKC